MTGKIILFSIEKCKCNLDVKYWDLSEMPCHTYKHKSFILK